MAMFMAKQTAAMKTQLRNVYILLLIFSNAVADQVSKSIARQRLIYHEAIEIIGKHFILMKVENRGAFLSTGDSLSGSVKFVFLTLIPLIAIFYGMYLLVTRSNMPDLLVIGICFVIGGGLGNLTDRLFYGSVTDFLHIDLFIIKTGIFNIGDISILIGMAMIVANLFFSKKEL
ncbi:MAG: signal peptidase II [Pedobacter sp.]|nr:signal peptidase II [Pedobacter sp.]